MAEGIKNNDWIKSVFRYYDQKMTNPERYEFERMLEMDPFLKDACEGMSTLKIGDVDKDLRQTDFIKGKKPRILSPAVYIALAALVLGLFVVLLVLQLNKEQNIKMNSVPENPIFSEQPDTLYQAKIPAFSFFTYTDSISVLPDGENILITGNNQAISELKEERPIISTKKEAKKIRDTAGTSNMAVLPSMTFKVKQDLSTPDVPLGGLMVVNEPVVQEDSNAEINQPETADPDKVKEPVQHDEVRPVRAGVNANPQPLGGNDLFNAYLSNNTRYPAGIENPKRETLRLQFKVSVSGDPKEFSVSRAPVNEAFTREAIRLINNGPRWSPAIKDGIPVEAEVSLRITFKP
jgi:hypothetical protein